MVLDLAGPFWFAAAVVFFGCEPEQTLPATDAEQLDFAAELLRHDGVGHGGGGGGSRPYT